MWQSAKPADLTNRVVVVIDVLRWSTVVVSSLANGAERVEAFATPDEARARADALGRHHVLLGGERHNRPLDGFDVGNSPLEYTPSRVAGKVVITSTTNGTSALVAAEGAATIFVAAFVNLEATVAVLRSARKEGRGLTLLCSGQAGAEALEDTACAGAIVDALLLSQSAAPADLEDSARRSRDAWLLHDREVSLVLKSSKHAATLRADGYEADVLVAGRLNAHPIAVSARDTRGHAEHPRSIVMYHT